MAVRSLLPAMTKSAKTVGKAIPLFTYCGKRFHSRDSTPNQSIA